MTLSHNVPQEETIIKLLTVLFPDATIYLFGSRALGAHTERSDIDISIDLGRKMTFTEIDVAKNIVEGLNIPQKVDIVCLHRARPTLRANILKEGIIWKK